MAWIPFRKNKEPGKRREPGEGGGEARAFEPPAFGAPSAGYFGAGAAVAGGRLNTSPIRLARRFGDVVFSIGKAGAEEIEEAAALAESEGMLLGRALIATGRLRESDVLYCLEQQKLVTSVDIGRLKIPPEVIATIPETLAHGMGVLPFDLVGDLLCVCAKSVLSFETVKAVRDRTRLRVRTFDSLNGWDELKACIDVYYPVSGPA